MGYLVADIKQVVRNLDNLKNNNKLEHKSLAQLYKEQVPWRC